MAKSTNKAKSKLPKIRKLDWVYSELAYTDDEGYKIVSAKFWDAEALGGNYYIMQCLDPRFPEMYRKFCDPYYGEDIYFDTLGEIVAHHQADYDKRILSELASEENA